MKRITVSLLLFLFLVTCSQSDIRHNQDLEDTTYSIVEDKNESVIRLSSLTTFDWEKAFLFSPYSPQEMIEEQLDVDFKDPSDLDMRDDIYLLVFLNKGKVVQYAEIERQDADFSIEGNLTPSNDGINIERY
ncbi:hypothetical protein MUN88_00955 [Gracilibacillus caseinilyticus]|uniref:Lipoprotein n=1 Tax=Gracilibacillus caseinilyticus TaxID=2932256 RepID=A0ABY4F2V0_9BACI|nr:hypothetical protein [Gracilibacillus caseinilyticus]UOQ48761.1 hypothetical protein MUN88_00955 [Gracilibacillus caseinilyticus]